MPCGEAVPADAQGNFLGVVTELISELRQPNTEFLNKARPPLLEPNPLFFWQSLSFILAVVIVLLLSK